MIAQACTLFDCHPTMQYIGWQLKFLVT
jgi:hypothetical protein